MNEFDKIKAFSKDIIEREEPRLSDPASFSDGESFFKEESSDMLEEEATTDEESSGLKGLQEEYRDRFGFSPIDSSAFEERRFMSMKWHIWALSVFAGLFIVVILGFVFLGDENENSDELIVITARETPVKERPEHPGGMVIPDQEKQIYDRLRMDVVPTKVESLFPAPEKPVVPDNLITDNQLAAVLQEEPYDVMEAPVVPSDVLALKTAVTTEDAPKKEKIVLEKQRSQDTKSSKISQATVSMPVPKPELKKSDNTDVSVKSKSGSASEKKSVKSESDMWRVQLMSSSNKETVEKAWPKILEKNKALLSNMSHEIKSVEIEGRGTFYRLRAGQFKSREMASGLCQKLKANKQDCVPSK